MEWLCIEVLYEQTILFDSICLLAVREVTIHYFRIVNFMEQDAPALSYL
jgi:hypothetical protein